MFWCFLFKGVLFFGGGGSVLECVSFIGSDVLLLDFLLAVMISFIFQDILFEI